MRRHSFTIVELIAVIAVVGILGAVGTMGLGAGVEGYVRGRNRMDSIQKAQNALQRMVIELRFVAFDANGLLLAVGGGGSSVTYTSRRDMQQHALVQSGSEILLDGKTLMDNVSEFEVTYSSASGAVAVRMRITDVGDFATSLYP